MTWAGVAIGGGIVASGALNYLGNQQSANAAQNAAQAQAAQAAANRKQIMDYSQSAGSNALALSQASPMELNSLGQAYQAQAQQLQQQQQLMSSIDPALMEASKQALSILRGGTATVNQPLMNMRNQQRAQLVNSLRAQYGPGAETTQIGRQALNQFDMQSDSMFQQNQQSSLSQLMGISDQGNAAQTANLQRSIAGLGSISQGYGSIQQRQSGTQLGVMGATLGALGGANNQMLQTAGAQYVGQGLQGQGLSSLGNMGMNIGAGLLGRQMGGFGGGGSGGYNNTVGNPAADFNPQNSFTGANPYS